MNIQQRLFVHHQIHKNLYQTRMENKAMRIFEGFMQNGFCSFYSLPTNAPHTIMELC